MLFLGSGPPDPCDCCRANPFQISLCELPADFDCQSNCGNGELKRKTYRLYSEVLYRVTSHLDSYILLTSVLEVPYPSWAVASCRSAKPAGGTPKFNATQYRNRGDWSPCILCAAGYTLMKLTLPPFLIPLPHLSPPSLSTAPVGQENWTPLKVISSATRKYLKKEEKFVGCKLSGEFSRCGSTKLCLRIRGHYRNWLL